MLSKSLSSLGCSRSWDLSGHSQQILLVPCPKALDQPCTPPPNAAHAMAKCFHLWSTGVCPWLTWIVYGHVWSEGGVIPCPILVNGAINDIGIQKTGTLASNESTLVQFIFWSSSWIRPRVRLCWDMSMLTPSPSSHCFFPCALAQIPLSDSASRKPDPRHPLLFLIVPVEDSSPNWEKNTSYSPHCVHVIVLDGTGS